MLQRPQQVNQCQRVAFLAGWLMVQGWPKSGISHPMVCFLSSWLIHWPLKLDAERRSPTSVTTESLASGPATSAPQEVAVGRRSWSKPFWWPFWGIWCTHFRTSGWVGRCSLGTIWILKPMASKALGAGHLRKEWKLTDLDLDIPAEAWLGLRVSVPQIAWPLPTEAKPLLLPRVRFRGSGGSQGSTHVASALSVLKS